MAVLLSTDGNQRVAEELSNHEYRIGILERTGGSSSGSVDTTPFVRKDTLTAKGALYVATAAGTVVELPVGADDEVLTADSTTPDGVSWKPGMGGPGVFPTYRADNLSQDIVFNASSTTLNEVANVLGTIVTDYPAPYLGYTITGGSSDKTLDASSTSLNEVANVLRTVILELEATDTLTGYTVSNPAYPTRTFNTASSTLNTLASVLCSFIYDIQNGVTVGSGSTADNTYRLVHEANGYGPASQLTAGTTYIPRGNNTNLLPHNTSSGQGVDFFNWATADYDVVGKTTQMRLSVQFLVNSVTPGADLTFSIGSITAPSGSGENIGFTVGADVSGSAITFSTPSANSANSNVSGVFSPPADGFYVPKLVLSGGLTPGCSIVARWTIHARTV